MEKQRKEISVDFQDELEEDELEEADFGPQKPRLTQFIPMILFLCLFFFLGTDFFVRNELKEKWASLEEITALHSVVFIQPKENIDSLLLEDIVRKVETESRPKQIIHLRQDSISQIDSIAGLLLLVSDKWQLEPLLYKHRHDPRIKGFALKNEQESVGDYFRMKWERLILACEEER